ncbi:hypothetical protein JCM11251_007000 [Rhodosporidiobolus azoricus]
MASSSPFSSPAGEPASPPPAYLPSASSSRRPSETSSYEVPINDVAYHSPSSHSLALSLSGPTPTPSRPLSFIDSEAPTRVGTPTPSIKEKKDFVDEEKAASEEEKVEEEEPYPEGGLRAWLAVAGSTMVLMVTFGFSNSYGSFLPYYHANQLSAYSTSQISWIGSAHLFITFSCAFGAGVLFDKGWFQWQLAVGSVGWLIGVFCLSLAETFWQIFLAQAVCMGLSLGAMFSPCLSVLGTYFRRRRAFVVGIAASGTAIGAVVFPILLTREFERKGFGEGVRSAGYFMLSLLLVANILLRPRRLSPPPSGPSSSTTSPAAAPKPPLSEILRSIATDRASWFVNLGVFCVYTCCFIPLFYVVSFAKQYGGEESVLATYSLSIINAVAFFSRILSGLLADRIGIFNLALPLALSVGALTFGMIGCTAQGPLVAFLVLFGAAQGGWISVSATCFMMLARDASEIGLRSGLGFFFVALAVLIGSPIAGALLQATGGSYVAALCFGGGLALIGCDTFEPPAGLIARSSAALSTAWTMKGYVLAALWSTLSYYTYGPPQSSWTLRLALFTSLARYHSSLTRSSPSSSSPPSPEKVVSIAQATRKKVAKLLADDGPGCGSQPKGGAVWEVEIGVKKRGLEGVLKEVDREEDGQRKVAAEWTVHRSLLPPPSSAPPSGDLPKQVERVLLYTHGGAYTLLSPRTHRDLVVQLSKHLRVRALSLDYRLSPEAKFPGALHDAVSAYFYLTEELGIPASSILVGGDSAGGNLVLALMLYLRDNGLPQVGGAVLISPWVDLTVSLGSWDENKDFDYLTLGDPASPLSPPRLFLPSADYDTLLPSAYVSPALSASFHDLPPLLVHSSGAETLRDEHTLLALRAAKAGVKVTHEVWQEGVHVAVAIMKDTVGKYALEAVREWGKMLGEVKETLPSGGKLAEVDGRLQAAWDARPDEEKKERSDGAGKTAPVPALFTYEKSFTRLPPIQLRETAHPKAKEAVKEIEDYEPEKELTAVWTAKPVPGKGVVGKVRGLLHL